MNTTHSDSDLQLIELLRREPMTISQLVDGLGVSANAVRQRLVKLMASGHISRQKSGEGPGRPCHTYELTEAGHRTAGDNFPDLARALWDEIQVIEDPQVRQNVMAGAIGRLLESYDPMVGGTDLPSRLKSVQRFFADRNIPIAVEQEDNLPILKVLACPYPDLVDSEHQVCEIEKRLFAKVIGSPVQLCQCRKDGDACCSFEAVRPDDESP